MQLSGTYWSLTIRQTRAKCWGKTGSDNQLELSRGFREAPVQCKRRRGGHENDHSTVGWVIPRGEVPTLSNHIHLSLCNNVPWKKSWKIFHFVNKMTLHALESLRQDQLLNLWSPLLKSSEFQASDSRASSQVAPCHCTGCNACDVSWAQHSQENQGSSIWGK